MNTGSGLGLAAGRPGRFMPAVQPVSANRAITAETGATERFMPRV